VHGADASAGVAVEVLVEEEVILEVRVSREALVLAREGAFPIRGSLPGLQGLGNMEILGAR
jgi:hypothetical protein